MGRSFRFMSDRCIAGFNALTMFPMTPTNRLLNAVSLAIWLTKQWFNETTHVQVVKVMINVC
jgi:hypothetical protein